MLLRISAAIIGLAVIGSSAAAQTCNGPACAGTSTKLLPFRSPTSKVTPRFEYQYVRQFNVPTINCGTCFGYYKPQWRTWDEVCGTNGCATPGAIAMDAAPAMLPTAPTPTTTAPATAPAPKAVTPPATTPPAAPMTTPPAATPPTTPKDDKPGSGRAAKADTTTLPALIAIPVVQKAKPVGVPLIPSVPEISLPYAPVPPKQ